MTDRFVVNEAYSGTIPVTVTLALEGTEMFEPGPDTLEGGVPSAPTTDQSGRATIVIITQGLQAFTAAHDPFVPFDGQTLEVTFELPAGQYFQATFTMELSQDIGNASATMEYSQTATASVTFPGGFSFTSSSGVFPSNEIAPATQSVLMALWMLILSSVIVLGLGLRLR